MDRYSIALNKKFLKEKIPKKEPEKREFKVGDKIRLVQAISLDRYIEITPKAVGTIAEIIVPEFWENSANGCCSYYIKFEINGIVLSKIINTPCPESTFILD